MELPSRAGEGRPHGGVAFVCRYRPGRSFMSIDCDDSRLCGVTVCDNSLPVLSVLGCYMPYRDSSGANLTEYAKLTRKLDALITALRASSPVLLAGDFNCALPRLPPDRRPPSWHRLQGFSPQSYLLQELLDEHDLAVAEFLFPQPVSYTYSRAGAMTHIDHMIVPTCLLSRVLSCTITPPVSDNLSPRLPLMCLCSLALNSSLSQG